MRRGRVPVRWETKGEEKSYWCCRISWTSWRDERRPCHRNHRTWLLLPFQVPSRLHLKFPIWPLYLRHYQFHPATSIAIYHPFPFVFFFFVHPRKRLLPILDDSSTQVKTIESFGKILVLFWSQISQTNVLSGVNSFHVITPHEHSGRNGGGWFIIPLALLYYTTFPQFPSKSETTGEVKEVEGNARREGHLYQKVIEWIHWIEVKELS